ncbi:probable amino-acid acetyltransferase [Roseobacter sp. SK209-2-6]|uniref:GNAT family N-acetyltransferase n=1 Tax=Roseobacter sp. SK209-2-6 TaxID=388739 RepID=UPI0000F3C788|nr:GNAT family protein [Roseobacter sp. SK209-2-6]EBA18129.1 probable amino-acid acetyltransferase [Roseobacter sp. SK209-2-6]
MWAKPVTLKGQHVTLAPLSPSHTPDLAEASADGNLSSLWYTSVPPPDAMPAEIARRLSLQETGSMLPFAILDAQGKAVGMTTYMNIDAANDRLEIGSTWYRKSVQRSGMNTECKYLMLRHAFETLGCIAVEFRTHRLNAQSRRAIERLGAQLDGILRDHMKMPNGTLRDTAVYSIISSEWPTIQAHLQHKMAR